MAHRVQPELDIEFAAAITRIAFRYIARAILLLAAIIFLIDGYIHVADRVRFENVDTRAGSKEEKESYFTKSPPSAEEIEAYLSDATIMTSGSAGQSRVAYFDSEHRMFRWRGDRIDEEFWTITSHLKVLSFESGTRRRWVFANTFCHGGPGVIGPDDHCWNIDSLDDILMSKAMAYRKGNVFNLRGAGPAPVSLPPFRAITMDELLGLMSSPKPHAPPDCYESDHFSQSRSEFSCQH